MTNTVNTNYTPNLVQEEPSINRDSCNVAKCVCEIALTLFETAAFFACGFVIGTVASHLFIAGAPILGGLTIIMGIAAMVLLLDPL